MCAGVVAGLANLRADPSDVLNYELQKITFYSQGSTTAPTTPTNWGTLSYITPASISSVSNPTVNPPSLPSINLLYIGGTSRWEFSQQYSTQAALDAAMPDGLYTLTVPTTSGSALTYTPSLNFVGSYPSAIPTLSNTSWVGGALVLDATVDNTLSWNVNPDTNFYLSLVGSLGDSYSWSGSAATLSQLISSGTLGIGETYAADLYFGNMVSTNTTDIPGVFGAATYYNDTKFFIQTTPEPSTLTLLATVGLCVLLTYRCKKRV